MSNARQLNADVADQSGDRIKLEFWPLDRLVPSARNARTHSDAQIAEIAGSIRAFGFTNPILIGEDGEVVAGHGRLEAARRLGLTEVPVIPLRGLTELQCRQLMLADNRIALNAGWDVEMLRLELKDLSTLGADLSTLGLTPRELAAALAAGGTTGLTDEDDVPELAEEAVTRAGDIWCMGAHRLACGDSTDATTVNELLGGQGPHLMVTDPPYGVEYDPGWREQRGLSRSGRRGKVRNDERADWSATWALFPGNIAYVWHAALRGLHGGGEPHPAGVQHSGADHLGQGAAGHWPRRLPMAARALLVRRPHQGQLDRRPEANDAVEHLKPGPGRRHPAQYPEAGRMHAAADAQQQRSGTSGLRSVSRQRNHPDRGGDHRPDVRRD
jgi:hypothetical protein